MTTIFASRLNVDTVNQLTRAETQATFIIHRDLPYDMYFSFDYAKCKYKYLSRYAFIKMYPEYIIESSNTVTSFAEAEILYSARRKKKK